MGHPLIGGMRITAAVSSVVTALMAWPVLISPHTTIFGTEFAGRHHDPFSAMRQFAAGGAPLPFWQPGTDAPGAWLSAVVGPVAAYNVIVLASLPLAAVAAHALGWYLWRSRAAAMVGGLAFAFAPAHLAHATYHPHVAQFHWVALYLLGLFAAIDSPTWRQLLMLGLAAAGLALSNFYGALIGAVVTPVVLAAWWVRSGRRWPQLVAPTMVLSVCAAVGLLLVAATTPMVFGDGVFATEVEDVSRYGARWWSYLLPPIDHPWMAVLGGRLALHQAGLPGVVEQQLFVGWALLILAVCVLVAALGGRLDRPVRGRVIALAAVGAWAAVVSFAPPGKGCSAAPWMPSCVLHEALPMFRAYARFGIVTGLSVALLAGLAVSTLSTLVPGNRAHALVRRGVVALLIVVAFEFWPSVRARDVLPSSAHRWLADAADAGPILDCAQWSEADAAVPWLMGRDLRFIATPFDGCDDPDLVPRLSALGYAYVIARGDRGRPWPDAGAPGGLTRVHDGPEADVYRLAAPPPPLVLLDLGGFHQRERHGRESWRWMKGGGRWVVRNTTSLPYRAWLDVELEAFWHPRHLAVSREGGSLIHHVAVETRRRWYRIGPLTWPPGDHVLVFESPESPARPRDVSTNTDRRWLTVMFRSWRWRAAAVDEEEEWPSP